MSCGNNVLTNRARTQAWGLNPRETQRTQRKEEKKEEEEEEDDDMGFGLFD